MPRTLAQIDWSQANQIDLRVKISKTKDPDLYEYLSNPKGRAALVREMLREGLELRKQVNI